MPPTSLQPVDTPTDPFVLYSRSLYDYTFQLWQQSKRAADESTHAQLAGISQEETRKEVDQSAIKQAG
jgi:hypothetical protein